MNLEQHQRIINTLLECSSTCDYCASACLGEDHVKELSKCIKLNIDCADICRLTAAFFSRNSESVNRVLKACADLCKECAIECEKHNMEHCKQCAAVCRKCFEECQEVYAVERHV